jgi:hypothetical protein
MITIFGGLVIGCPQGTDIPPPQKRISITGIPPEYDAKHGTVAFGHEYNGNTLAASDTVLISNGTVTTKLYDYNAEPYTEIFTKDGKYIILFIITNMSGSELYWAGAIGPLQISGETTSIPFADFFPIPISNRSLSTFDFSDILLQE